MSIGVCCAALAGCSKSSDADEVTVGHIPTTDEQRAVSGKEGVLAYYATFPSMYRIDSRALVAVRGPSYKETWSDAHSPQPSTQETNKRFIDQAGHGTVDNKKAGPTLVLLDSCVPVGASIYVTGYMEGDWYVYDGKGKLTDQKKPFHSRFKATWEKDSDGRFRLLTTSFGPEVLLTEDESAKLKETHGKLTAK